MRRRDVFLAAAHAVLVAGCLSAPWWLDWRLVLLGVALFYAQLALVRGCVLSMAQFGERETTFHGWYLAKLGFRPRPATVRFIVRGVLPSLIALAAFLVQRG